MKLTELGLTSDEMSRILIIARIFNASRMTCEEIKLVDKQDIYGILVSKEGK